MNYPITDLLDERHISYVLQGDIVRCTCPDDIHVPRKGRTSTREDSFALNVVSGLWNCWTCGAKGNAMHLINDLGFDPEIYWHLDLDLEPSEGSVDKTSDYECSWVLNLPMPPARFLKERRLDENVTHELGIRWWNKYESWVIPVGDPPNLVGYEMKGPQGVRAHGPKGNYLFGSGISDHSTIMLMESPLDVARVLTVCGDLPIEPVASYGAQVTGVQLNLLAHSDVIVAMDNDEAGMESTRRVMGTDDIYSVNAQGYERARFDYMTSPAKDPGDMSDSDLYDSVLDGLSRIQNPG